MRKKYSTDELVEALEAYGIANAIIEMEEILAIIAQLRAADKLCEVAQEGSWQPGSAQLRKVIANYKGTED